MFAYVHQVDGQWYSTGGFACYLGFTQRGYHVEPFVFQDLLDKKLSLSRSSIVHGGIGAVREALTQLGCPLPENVDHPDCLKAYLGREIRSATMADVRAMEDFHHPIHVKPLHGHKAFTGRVMKGKRADNLLYLAHVPSEMEVLIQEHVEFVSEWRCYVLRGELLGIGHYAGDPLLFPAREAILGAIDAYVDSPVAYGLDMGVTADGRTLLVEINDAFSLGNYGLNHLKYSELIEARWCEMVGV